MLHSCPVLLERMPTVLHHQRLLLTTPHDVPTMAPVDPWSVMLPLDMHDTDCCNYCLCHVE
jgi:hypothetical protein